MNRISIDFPKSVQEVIPIRRLWPGGPCCPDGTIYLDGYRAKYSAIHG